LVRAQSNPDSGRYPAVRAVRAVPAPPSTDFTIHPNERHQTIAGLGFEIQSDSIGSGNGGMPESFSSVPHDLVPAERERLAAEMLRGFRYCRLAGGLYWRGLDQDQKQLEPRWPEQLDELRALIAAAGIEGVSLEYWSPAPYWKANRSYVGRFEATNVLRCYGPDFASDPVYHGDVDRFLRDFAAACRRDLQTLRDHGIPVALWGLQNEPHTEERRTGPRSASEQKFDAHQSYSTCGYTPATYARTFRAVAPVIRAWDPRIKIIADTGPSWNFPYIRSVLDDPNTASLVDALVIHHVGSNSSVVNPPPEPSGKPRFQNEYEYQPPQGPATPDKCLNTVQHIMNWFQRGQAPTWFWIHALKPYTNAEASGYSLGFWRPPESANDAAFPHGLQPGHWIWNPYNWNAVGSFIRHLPWNSTAVAVDERQPDEDLRILAFLRPSGKLTVVVSNRSHAPHRFQIETGRPGSIFEGLLYTPDNAGPDCRGNPAGTATGGRLSVTLPDLAWAFWEEI
jgi:O-glycosyl hydrolase